jgi:general secretion pathway protein A
MGVYERFFKLHDEPFRLTPDPRYLFPSAKHQEVLAHLRLGITESGGFVCITGDVGTGKTTLVRAFLDQIGANTPYAYLFNPPQSSLELLQTISGEFGLAAAPTSRKVLMDELNAFLLAQRRAGHRPLVVVDEAQALPPEVLEELRLLSNLETSTTKLLHIVLFGQPQLADLLQSADLAQLNQRITLRWHLGPLDRQETAAYVRHRLRVAAGGVERALFSSRALARIHRHTGGVPRLINMFCHRCLLAAFAEERPCVTMRVVERVRDEIQRIPLLGPRPRAPRRALRTLAWGAGAAALAAGLAVAVLRTDAVSRLVARQALERPAHRPAGPAAGTGEPADGATEAAPATKPPRLAMLTAPPTPASAPPVTAPASGDTAAVDIEAVPSAGDGRPARPEATVETRGGARMLDTAEATRMLLGSSEESSIIAALKGALERWDEPPLMSDEVEIPIDIGLVANRRDLEHLPISGSMNMLRVLNLPAILEITLPEANGPRYALLQSIGADSYVLGLENGSFAVKSDFVDIYWMGLAHVIWRDFERLAPVLRRGSTGPRVGRLQQMLADLGLYAGPINDVFGTDTETAVISFQRSRRLFADALVGQMTRIALYDALGDYPHPRLMGQETERAGGNVEADT